MKDQIKYAKEHFFKKAQEIYDNKEKVFELIDKAKEYIKNSPLVQNTVDNINIFFRMLKAYFNGTYTNIEKQKVLLIIMSLVYLVVPTDLVLDTIPILGLIDDAKVIAYVFTIVKDEVAAFKEFEQGSNI